MERPYNRLTVSYSPFILVALYNDERSFRYCIRVMCHPDIMVVLTDPCQQQNNTKKEHCVTHESFGQRNRSIGEP